MPQLLDSISTIISVFYKHGKKDEDCSTISKREVKRFIQREFDNITVNPYDAHTIEAVLQLLDRDGDGAVDFNEFLLLVFRVAKVCYWYLQPKQHLPQRTETGLSGERRQEPEAGRAEGSRDQPEPPGTEKGYYETRESETREIERSCRQPREPEPRGDQGGHYEIREPKPRENERSRHQLGEPEPRGDERRRYETREPEPREEERRHPQPREPEPRGNERSHREPFEQPREPEPRGESP
ncbi:Repetin [Chelonia mydas]|uniref:Repetin n=1 Tax=Chelonia mydas TaxID=8469 RepID=M7BTA4_CHEMY|nr:Repetin [Chelonia mydas]